MRSRCTRAIKAKQSRVFLGARRSFLDCDTHYEANEKAKAQDGKGVSAQLFGITRKLKELDSVLSPKLQRRVMECHPELVFWRLNQKKAVPRKKTSEGIELRKRLLLEQGFDRLEEFLEGRKGRGAKIDDILDACACAIAARDANSTQALGGKPDRKGLRMEIHY